MEEILRVPTLTLTYKSETWILHILPPFLIWGIYNSWSIKMDYITPPDHLVLLLQPPNRSKSSYCLIHRWGNPVAGIPRVGMTIQSGKRGPKLGLQLEGGCRAGQLAPGSRAQPQSFLLQKRKEIEAVGAGPKYAFSGLLSLGVV